MTKICDPDLIDVQILLESHPETLLHVGKNSFYMWREIRDKNVDLGVECPIQSWLCSWRFLPSS